MTVIRLLLALLLAGATSTASLAQADYFRGPDRARAQKGIERLGRIHARHVDAIMARPGVIGFGIGLDHASADLNFVVYVEDGMPVPSDLPDRIQGVEVTTELTAPFETHHGGAGCVPCHSNQTPLPAEMGNSGFSALSCASCTIGFKACDLDTFDIVYITNAHCSTDASGCEQTAPITADTMHRSRGDAACVLTADIGDVMDHAPVICGGPADLVDGAEILSNGAETSFAHRDIGVPDTMPGLALVGDIVQKSGRTSGHTFGEVTAVGATVTVVGYCCGASTFADQIVIRSIPPEFDPVSLPGDSGSGWLSTETPPKVVGLNFAGGGGGSRAIANTIANVVAAFNLSLDPAACEEGASCINGRCHFGTKSRCEENGGNFLGVGTTCDDVDCSKGACCFDDLDCHEGTRHQCEVHGGEYQGDGSTCDLEPCVDDGCDDPGSCATGFPSCGGEESCLCFATPDGEGFCWDSRNSGLCARFSDCVDGTCPDGFRCVIDTCCGVPKCLPEAEGCGAAASPVGGGDDGGPTLTGG